MFAFLSENPDSVIAPVGNELSPPGIHGQGMRIPELTVILPPFTEMSNIIAIGLPNGYAAFEISSGSF